MKSRPSLSSWWRARPLILVGTVGVLSLIPSFAPLVNEGRVVSIPGLAPPAQLLVMLINPLLFLCIAATLGARFGARSGFRSHLVDAWTQRAPIVSSTWKAFAPDARSSAIVGLAVGLLTVLVDTLVFQPYMSNAWQEQLSPERWSPTELLTGVLYGGITEEILSRWGVMTGLCALFALLTRRQDGIPTWVVWAGIGSSALLFAAGHLPLANALGKIDGVLLTRTLFLNGVGGVVFGWLYARRSLESAMLAHASAHVGFAIAALAGLSMPAG